MISQFPRMMEDSATPQKDTCGQLLPPAQPVPGDIDDFIFADDEYYVSQR